MWIYSLIILIDAAVMFVSVLLIPYSAATIAIIGVVFFLSILLTYFIYENTRAELENSLKKALDILLVLCLFVPILLKIFVFGGGLFTNPKADAVQKFIDSAQVISLVVTFIVIAKIVSERLDSRYNIFEHSYRALGQVFITSLSYLSFDQMRLLVNDASKAGILNEDMFGLLYILVFIFVMLSPVGVMIYNKYGVPAIDNRFGR